MNTSLKKIGQGLLGILFLVIIDLAIIIPWNHVGVIPASPKGATSPVELPATTSHLSVVVTFPKTVIAAQLERVMPKKFPFDVNSDGVRAYGSPSRGAITVVNDVAARRVSASTPVSGRVQVGKRIILVNASVGIDVSGVINASLSPIITPKWTINPQLSLSAQVNRAVAKTFLGDIDITGQVRGPVGNAVNGIQGTAVAKLKEALDVRKEIERLWNEMNRVHKLTDNPPTWLRITPKLATFGKFHFTNDSIDSGLALDLEMRVFLQDTKPEVLKSPLPDLRIAGALSDDFEMSIPVEVSYSVINQQFKAQLTKSPINLPQNVSMTITDATIAPYGDGILLTVDFSGKKGWIKSASGRLFFVGIPVFDVVKAELRMDKLAFTAETKSILLKTVDWLAHEILLDAMKRAAVITLDGELKEAKQKANEELAKLKEQLPKEVGANVSVTKISVERLAFAKERAFAVVAAKGKMSAQLKP